MAKCIFCEIVKGTASCTKVYEDKATLAFLDIDPLTKGHVLIIPKAHYENIRDIDEKTLSQLTLAAKKVATKIYNEGTAGINILHASGHTAGQSVFHFHLHIVPRNNKDEIEIKKNKISKK